MWKQSSVLSLVFCERRVNTAATAPSGQRYIYTLITMATGSVTNNEVVQHFPCHHITYPEIQVNLIYFTNSQQKSLHATFLIEHIC